LKITEIEKYDYDEVIGLIKAEFPYVHFDIGKIKERIESSKIFIFKAVEGKKLLGFIEIELMKGELARINGLTVKKEYRNRGVAKKLIGYAVSFLKKKKVERVLLLVKQGNDAAKKIYREAGFRFIGMYNRELDNVVVEEMELDFKPKDERDLSYVG